MAPLTFKPFLCKMPALGIFTSKLFKSIGVSQDLLIITTRQLTLETEFLLCPPRTFS